MVDMQSELMKIKHVLIPIGALYPVASGGPAISMSNLLKRYINGNPDVKITVVTHAAIGQDWLRYYPNNINFIQIKASRSWWTLFRLTLVTISILRRCDIIHLNSIFFRPNMLLLPMAIVFKKLVIVSPRGELLDAAINKNRFKLIYLKLYQIFFQRIIFHFSTEYERKMSAKVVRVNRNIVVPNIIEVEPTIDLASHRKYFLYLGRFDRHKNIHLAIEAFNHIETTGWRLILCGDGDQDYITECKLMARDTVIFYGYKNGREKDALIQNACALILPSKSENFGNVVGEALLKKTPAVVSKFTAWNELSTNTEALLIVDTEASAIKEKMLSLVSMNPYEYERIAEDGYRFFNDFQNGSISLSENFYNQSLRPNV